VPADQSLGFLVAVDVDEPMGDDVTLELRPEFTAPDARH
jgi:hypothetical protein